MNRLVVVVVAAVVVAAGLAARVLLGGTDDEVVAVGDQLAVGADWALEAEAVVPDRVLCLGDNPCPSLNRRYQLPAPLTQAEFADLVTRSGWDWPVSGDCRPDPSRLGFFTVCSTEGRRGAFAVSLRQDTTENVDDGAVVQLLVRPAGG